MTDPYRHVKTVSNEVVLIANNHYCSRLTIPKHRHTTQLQGAATNIRPLQGLTEPRRQVLSWWAMRSSWEPTTSSNKGTLRLITGCERATLTCYIGEQWSLPGSSILSLPPHNTDTLHNYTALDSASQIQVRPNTIIQTIPQNATLTVSLDAQNQHAVSQCFNQPSPPRVARLEP